MTATKAEAAAAVANLISAKDELLSCCCHRGKEVSAAIHYHNRSSRRKRMRVESRPQKEEEEKEALLTNTHTHSTDQITYKLKENKRAAHIYDAHGK